MNIEVYKRNRAKDFSEKIKSKMEDIYFSILLRLPEKWIPMEKVERYLNKREAELKHQDIKLKWRNSDLETAVKEIRKRG